LLNVISFHFISLQSILKLFDGNNVGWTVNSKTPVNTDNQTAWLPWLTQTYASGRGTPALAVTNISLDNTAAQLDQFLGRFLRIPSGARSDRIGRGVLVLD
jgi:hypothetical protein